MTELHVPPELTAALIDAGLEEEFAEISPDHQREYAEWIDSAPSAADRAERIAEVVGKLAVRSGEG